MASKRYSRNRSNYILRKKHQYTDAGVIYERDWTTLGEREKLSPGKRQYLRNGNFIFTTNIINSYKKRRNGSEWIEGLTYDDVENASNLVNYVKVSYNGDRLDDYAYFGSAVELVKGTVSNIIANYPASIVIHDEHPQRKIIKNYTSSEEISSDISTINSAPSIIGSDTTDDTENVTDDYYEEKYISLVDEYHVSNPFLIDLIHKAVDGLGVISISDDENPMRFMTYSYKNYIVKYIDRVGDDKKDDTNIVGYSVGEWLGDTDCPENDYYGVEPVVEIEITLGNGDIVHLKAYASEDGYMYTSDVKNIVITPKDSVFEDFYNEYDGFESKLLNRSSNPIFTCTLKIPTETYNGLVKMIKRKFTWSNDGYNPDISSASYGMFLQSLLSAATSYDEYYSDNLYNKMTHESIKNFDWSYTRVIDEEVEAENTEGGTRMEKLLRIYGRMFDDMKRHIDGVKMMQNITYDGVNNVPDAMLSDTAEIKGWDFISTIPVIEGVDTDTLTITNDFITKYGIRWYSTRNSEGTTCSSCDLEFTRRLILNSARIFKTKGTSHSIDMVMGMFGFGNEDYTLTEKYYETIPIVLSDEFTQKVYDANYDKTLDHYITDEYGNLAYDPYDGIPLKNIYIGNTEYVVPYIEKDKSYDGDLYYQSLGGWCHKNNIDKKYGYMETYSYLHEATDITALLGINPYSVKEGDYYYVNDISDYVEYIENVPENLSHFFKLIDEYATDEIEGWKNIPMDEANSDTRDYKICKYLETIITTSDGNNPHVGYGNYDDGDDYIKTMSKPFKYALDGWYFNSEDGYDKADSIEFKMDEKTSSHIENQTVRDDKVKVITTPNPKKYYINSKVFVFRNNINSKLYKDYFRSIILPYVQQVIPSTTILILENV